MSLSWDSDTFTAGLTQFRSDLAAGVEDALAQGAGVILADAKQRAPKESGDLAAGGQVQQARGGRNTVGLWFPGPYARWIHEHLNFKHPRGGEPKFLETAMLVKGAAALRVAGERMWRRG